MTHCEKTATGNRGSQNPREVGRVRPGPPTSPTTCPAEALAKEEAFPGGMRIGAIS
jgi:hypothetical protein